MQKKVYTVKEVSQVMCIGLNKTYDLIHENKIPYIKLGKKYVIPIASLNNWLDLSAGGETKNGNCQKG